MEPHYWKNRGFHCGVAGHVVIENGFPWLPQNQICLGPASGKSFQDSSNIQLRRKQISWWPSECPNNLLLCGIYIYVITYNYIYSGTIHLLVQMHVHQGNFFVFRGISRGKSQQHIFLAMVGYDWWGFWRNLIICSTCFPRICLTIVGDPARSKRRKRLWPWFCGAVSWLSCLVKWAWGRLQNMRE